MSAHRKQLRVALAAVLAAAVADFAGFKLGAWSPGEKLFGVLMTIAAILAVAEVALTARELVRGPRRLARAGRIAALLGLVAMWGGGLATRLGALRGFTVLVEGDTVPLAGGRQFEALEAGPLADRDAIDALVKLEKLELRDADGGFYPEATAVVSRAGHVDERFVFLQDAPARLGPLRLFVGAFGYAPRIVVLNGEQTVFDDTVMFATKRQGDQGVAFEGDAAIDEKGLRVVGVVKLGSPGSAVRGHPTVWLSLRRGDEELGAGELQLGHFAAGKDGYSVGLAGLKKWAELDVSRRTRREPVLAGMALVVAGSVAWGAGAWRRRAPRDPRNGPGGAAH